MTAIEQEFLDRLREVLPNTTVCAPELFEKHLQTVLKGERCLLIETRNKLPHIVRFIPKSQTQHIFDKCIYSE